MTLGCIIVLTETESGNHGPEPAIISTCFQYFQNYLHIGLSLLLFYASRWAHIFFTPVSATTKKTPQCGTRFGTTKKLAHCQLVLCSQKFKLLSGFFLSLGFGFRPLQSLRSCLTKSSGTNDTNLHGPLLQTFGQRSLSRQCALPFSSSVLVSSPPICLCSFTF